MTGSVVVTPVTGGDIERYIPDLAGLRIEVFRDFPYLYDGSLDYEAAYLRTLSEAKGSLAVLARDGERCVGVSTALPLSEETDEVKAPFAAKGYDPDTVFYFAESVLLSAYRGQGIGVRFFEEREAHARSWFASNGLSAANACWFAFCGVERAHDDPRRPAGYVPLDRFWAKRGYTKHPELRTHFSWKDVGEPEETKKPLVFWLKPA